jgi:predicted PurR-regulated permease PerM
VLFVGDKVVRPLIARNATRLHFVWVLMGCLGGFEALGLVGLVIGPVALSLTRELWEQRVRDLPAEDNPDRREHDASNAAGEEATGEGDSRGGLV